MTSTTAPTAPTAPLLVGLVGFAGAGKDTVAAYLEDQYAFARIALADPIRSMLGALFDDAELDPRWLTDRALKESPSPLGPSYRHLAQTLGTEWGRHLSPHFWVRIAQLKAGQAHHRGDNVVISDARFENEFAWITQAGGVLVRIHRDTVVPVRAHASEQGITAAPTQYEIWNTASVATLHDQIDRLMTELRAERVA